MSIISRVLGGAIGGAGTYAGLTLFAPDLGTGVIAGVAVAMAAFGLLFGPKIWEAVAQLL